MKAKDLAAAFVAGTMTLEAVFLAMSNDARDLIKARKCSVPAAVHACWEEQFQKFSSFCRIVGTQADVTQTFESWLRASGFAAGLFQERDRKLFKARELARTAVTQLGSITTPFRRHLLQIQEIVLENFGAPDVIGPDHAFYADKVLWLADDTAELHYASAWSVTHAITGFIKGLAEDLLRMPDFAEDREYAYREIHRALLMYVTKACVELQMQNPKACISTKFVPGAYITAFQADKDFMAWVKPEILEASRA